MAPSTTDQLAGIPVPLLTRHLSMVLPSKRSCQPADCSAAVRVLSAAAWPYTAGATATAAATKAAAASPARGNRTRERTKVMGFLGA